VIRRHNAQFIAHPDRPTIVFDRHAAMECGCVCICGVRGDTGEAATASMACSDEHKPLMAIFQQALLDSLDHPEDREMVEVADELLSMTFAEGAA